MFRALCLFLVCFCLPVSAQELRGQFPFDGYLRALVLAPDGDALYIASGEQPIVRLWDVEDRRVLRRFRDLDITAQPMAISADGRWLAIADSCEIHIRDTRSGETRILLRDSLFLTALVFHPDGKHIVSANQGHTIKVWSLATGREQRRMFAPELPLGLAVSPDGTLLLSAGRPDVGILWDLWAAREIARITSRHVVRTAAFSPDGNTVLFLEWSPDITVRDARTLRDILSIKTDEAFSIFAALAFSPDGRRIVTVVFDGTVIVYDSGTGEELNRASLPGYVELRLVADKHGRLFLAGATMEYVDLWDLSELL